jgi:hypothetical protein
MADTDLAVPAAGQPDDVGRLLDVGRERLLNEHMTTALKRVHGRRVVVQVRGEDGQDVRRGPPEQLPMSGERGRGGLAPPHRHARRQRLGRGEVAVGATDHVDALEGREPIEMDPRRETASRDPDPEHGLRHPSTLPRRVEPTPTAPSTDRESDRATLRHHPSNLTVPRQEFTRVGQAVISDFRRWLRANQGSGAGAPNATHPPAPIRHDLIYHAHHGVAPKSSRNGAPGAPTLEARGPHSAPSFPVRRASP